MFTFFDKKPTLKNDAFNFEYFLKNRAHSLSPNDKNKIVEIIHYLLTKTESLMSKIEILNLYCLVKNTLKITGDIAEVGVYKGASAYVLCEACNNKEVYLFDTFEGIPSVDEHDHHSIYKGKNAAKIEEVKNLLKNYSNVHIFKGDFPFPCAEIQEKKFAFVHLDVDTHKGTKECMNYFYPKMSPGGIIISHNYLNCRGVYKAMHDFVKEKAETVINYVGSFGMIVKQK